MADSKVTFAPQKNVVLRLAQAFHGIVGEVFTEDEIVQTDLKNTRRRDGTCATHDYCDANELMAEAFARCGVEEDSGLWNAAWSFAKRVRFGSEWPADAAARRVRIAVERADDAFWAAVAEAFPEVTTGDFSPLDTLRIEKAMRDAVSEWLTSNHPDTYLGEEVAS